MIIRKRWMSLTMERIFWVQESRAQTSKVQVSSHPESKRPVAQSPCQNVHCPCQFQYAGKTYSYLEEAALPKQCIRKDHVFSYVSINYTGPIQVKNVYSSDVNMHKAGIVTFITGVAEHYIQMLWKIVHQFCV